MKDEPDMILFESTGRREYCNCGILGIDAKLELSEGYDGGFGPDTKLKQYNADEINELANHMIARWNTWRHVQLTELQ